MADDLNLLNRAGGAGPTAGRTCGLILKPLICPEPPDADPHVRWCGGWEGNPPRDPIGLRLPLSQAGGLPESSRGSSEATPPDRPSPNRRSIPEGSQNSAILSGRLTCIPRSSGSALRSDPRPLAANPFGFVKTCERQTIDKRYGSSGSGR